MLKLLRRVARRTETADLPFRPRLPRRFLVAVPVAVVALALVGTVIAYWTTTGAGAATASVGTLSAPTDVAGVQDNADVDVTWTAGSVTGGGVVEYHVERRDDSGATWTSVCGSTAAVPIGGTSCTDTSVSPGDYRYRVTGIYRSWTAESSESAKVTVVSLDATPPDFGSPALTITGTFTPAAGQYLSGTTVFYNPQGGNAGGFTVAAPNVTDPETGISKVSFPALAGFSGGGDDTTPSHDSAYAWTASSSATGAQTVTAYNGASPTPLTSTTTFTVTPDTANPTGGAITANGSPVASYNTTGTIALLTTGFGDSGSGIATNVITRAAASLIADTCGFITGSTVVTTDFAGIDTSTLGTGCYRYTLTGTDNVGNVETTTSAVVKVDTSPPSTPALSLSNVTGSTYYAGSGSQVFFRPAGAGAFKLTASSSDAHTGVASYTFPGSLGTNWATAGTGDNRTYTFTAGASAPGTNNVKATNGAGADSTDAPFTVTEDSTAPTGGSITANGNGSDSFNTTGTVALAKTDLVDGGSGMASNVVTRASVAWSGGACGTPTGSTPVTINGSGNDSDALADGCYRYTLTGTDNVGNAATVQSAIVKVDTVKPTTTIALSPAAPNGSNGWYKGPIAPTFTLSATDAHSGVATRSYQIDAGPTQTYTSAVSIPDGTHTIRYWSADNAGNVEVSSTTAAIKVDTANPSGSVTSPAAGTVNGTVALKALTAADTGGSGVASVQYFYCAGPSCTPSTSIGTSSAGPDYQVNWDTTTLANGAYVLRGIVTDAAGNTANTATVAVTVNNVYTFVVSNPGSQTAGTPFGGLTIQLQLNGVNATDRAGTPYTGAKTITYSGTATAAAPDGSTATSSSSVSFTDGFGTVPAGAITLVRAGTGVTLSLIDSTVSPTITGSTSLTVAAGAAARLAWSGSSVNGGTLSSVCLFTCTWTAANNKVLSGNVTVTDTRGNIVSALGTGHSASLSLSGSSANPGTRTPTSVTFPGTGLASVGFTYNAPNGSWTSETLTAATTVGTVYTSATITASK